MTCATDRGLEAAGSGLGTRGRTSVLSTVMAGTSMNSWKRLSVGGCDCQSEKLFEPVDHHVPALHIGNGLAPDDLVLSGELAGAAGGSDRHHDGDAHGLIGGEVRPSLGERVDVVHHGDGLEPGEARHLA